LNLEVALSFVKNWWTLNGGGGGGNYNDDNILFIILTSLYPRFTP